MKVMPSAVLIGTFWTSFLQADVALFGRSTDTIRVDNNLVSLGAAATYEARILFTTQHAGFGLVFNEHTFALEDKQLLAGPEGIRAFSHGLTTETPGEITASIPLVCRPLSALLYYSQFSPRPLDLSQDVGAFRAPLVGLRVEVPLMQVVQDGGAQFLDALEASVAHHVLRQVSEESLHHVHPRAACRREMEVEARAGLEPPQDLGMLVGGVVVDD